MKLAIFDLDGTLLDTLQDLGNACNYALKKNNLPTHAIEAYKNMVGNGIKNLVKRAIPDEMYNVHLLEKTLLDFTNYYEANKFDSTKPYEGIIAMLNELRSNGVKLAIASNKYHDAVIEIVPKYFSDFNFLAILGSRENVPKKPNPEIVYDVLKLLPNQKIETFFIGDSDVDMQTAKNANITAIGVEWGFRTKKELLSNGADFIANKALDVSHYILNY